MKLMGIDIGTTSICGVIVDVDSGRVVDSITRPNQSAIASLHPWEHLQDPSRILDEALTILQACVSRHGHLDALCVTGQMHGIVYVDGSGRAVSPLFTWQDGRGDLPFRSSTYRQTLTELTGYRVFTGFGLVTHYYLLCNHHVPDGAATCCTIADYVAMKLGQHTRPVIDLTNAAGLGVFDVVRQTFDDLALQHADIDSSFLPAVVPSATKVGETANGAAVYAGLGDNQASFLGAVKRPAESLLVNIGTGGQVSLYNDVLTQISGWENRPFPGGGYLWVGASLSGGKSYAMLEQFFRRVCRLFTDLEPDSLYDRMDEVLRTTAPPADPLVVKTQFYGTRKESDTRGSIENIGPNNWTPEHLMVGFLEGMVDELIGFYDDVPEPMKAHIATCIGSGNAIRRNAFLRRAIERRVGLSLSIPQYAEEAALGAAICAGVGHGVFAGFRDGSNRLVRY